MTGQLPDDAGIAPATVSDLMDMIESRYSGQITPRDLDVAKVAFAAGAGQPCGCWCHTTDSAVPSPTETEPAMTCTCDMDGRGNACHCRACCLTFSGITAFDHHITGGQHHPPAQRGLSEVRPAVWGFPATDASRERLRILRAERDQAKVTGHAR